MILATIDSVVLKYGRLYAEARRAGNRSQDPYTLYTDCEKRFLRWDQAYRVSLFPSMHLTGKHIFTLLILLILGDIETNPGPTPCAFVTVATGINTAAGAVAEDGYT